MASISTTNCQEDSDWLETLLHKYNQDNFVSRIVGVSKEDITVKGDNYCSNITRITLELYLHSGRKSKRTLFMKSPIDLTIPLPVFKTEIKVYETILAEFNALMQNHQDPYDTLWCEMIGHDGYNSIVLEDLKAQHFKLADRKALLDLNHGLLVLHSLGRLHGMSHVLIRQGILDKNDLGDYLFSRTNPFSSRLLEGGLQQFASVMEEFWPSEWNETAQKFAKESKLVVDKVLKIVEYSNDAFHVMNHGDCWTCNLMFKYCPYDDTLPIALKFLDFQISTINSYIIDLMHFIYMCIRPDDRRKNLNRLLKEYHKSLSSTLEFYNMPGIAPSLEQVYADAKNAEYLGMIFTTSFLPVSSAERSNNAEPFSMEKLLGTGEPKDAFNPDAFKTDKFRKSIEPDIRHWVAQGII